MITNLLRVAFTRSLKPFEFTNNNNHKLNLDVPELGIYVHIPFCTTLCPFCPYNKQKYEKTLAAKFKNALIKEINLVGNQNKQISSVYFGGGSPALLVNELEDILIALRTNFEIKSNIGIELHPKDINQEILTKLKIYGFDMISIGIQTFNETCLQTLGRDYINGEEKIKLVSDFKFSTINVDLIFGIDGQNEKILKEDFSKAFNNGASQVSTYPFIDFSYAQNKTKPLGKKHKKQFLAHLSAISDELDCRRTAVWTFAKKGTNKYSSITRDNFIGFGPSATTLLQDLFKINTFSVEEYIDTLNQGIIPTALTLNFTERTRTLYWLFWNSYTLEIKNENFKKIFNKDLNQLFKFELRVGKLLGLLRKTKAGYQLTKKGAYKYHLVELAYTNQYIDKTWKIARNNPWPQKIKLY